MIRQTTTGPRTVRDWNVNPEVLDLVDDRVLSDILTVVDGGPCPEWIRDRIGRPRSKEWQDWCVRFRVKGSVPGIWGQWLVGMWLPFPAKPRLDDRGWFVIRNDGDEDLVPEFDELADALLAAKVRSDGYRGDLFPDDPTGRDQ